MLQSTNKRTNSTITKSTISFFDHDQKEFKKLVSILKIGMSIEDEYQSIDKYFSELPLLAYNLPPGECCRPFNH